MYLYQELTKNKTLVMIYVSIGKHSAHDVQDLYIIINYTHLFFRVIIQCSTEPSYSITYIIVSPEKPKPGYNVIRQSVGFTYLITCQ